MARPPSPDDSLARRILEGGVFESSELEEFTREAETETQRLTVRYELLELVGRGAFGEVHRARDRSMDRVVALKRVRLGRIGPARAADIRARFRRELQALANLRHEGIPAVFDAGVGVDSLWLVMQYVEGRTLEAVIEARDTSLVDRVRIVEEVAAILDFAHAHGFVHRDVKPSNVLVGSDGRARVVDFGLAKALDDATSVTKTGVTLGTPQYMSPEQARGESREADARSDVFALGAVLYHALGGQPPFRGTGLLEVVVAIASAEPEPLRSIAPDVPAALEAIVARALEKDPARRWPSAGALAGALGAWRQGAAPPAGAPQAALARASRSLTPVLALALGSVVLGAGAALWPASGPAPTAPAAPVLRPVERPKAVAPVESVSSADPEPVPATVERALASWRRLVIERLHPRRGPLEKALAPLVADLDRARRSGDKDSEWAGWIRDAIGPGPVPADLLERANAIGAADQARGAVAMKIAGDRLVNDGEFQAAMRHYGEPGELEQTSGPVAAGRLAGRALAIARAIAAHAPDDPNQGAALCAQAAKNADAALALDPGSPEAALAVYRSRELAPTGLADAGAGPRRLATADLLARAAAASANDPVCLAILARVLLDHLDDQKDPAERRALAERVEAVVRRAPGSPVRATEPGAAWTFWATARAHAVLAGGEDAARHRREAEASLKLLLEIDPDDADARRLLASIQEASR